MEEDSGRIRGERGSDLITLRQRLREPMDRFLGVNKRNHECFEVKIKFQRRTGVTTHT